MDKQNFDPSLDEFQSQLQVLKPAGPEISEAQLMYRCGWEAALASSQCESPSFAWRPFLSGLASGTAAGFLVVVGIYSLFDTSWLGTGGNQVSDGGATLADRHERPLVADEELSESVVLESPGVVSSKADVPRLNNTPVLAWMSPGRLLAGYGSFSKNGSLDAAEQTLGLSPAARYIWGSALVDRKVGETPKRFSAHVSGSASSSTSLPTLHEMSREFGLTDFF